MAMTATKVFNFLENNDGVRILKHEIALVPFSMLRQNLRKIALNLHESGEYEALEISRQIRVLLSEWLTTPVKFHHSILGDMISDLFGEADAVQKRWGNDIRIYYDSALKASSDLSNVKSPVRQKVREIILELRKNKQGYKVYCHRMARQHFDSLLIAPDNLPIEETAYLHSFRDYRKTEPFDVLIKVGSLRSRGWGSAPDAFLTAPRFKTLTQIVWSGCNDETDFGFDPVLCQQTTNSSNKASLTTSFPTGCSPVKRSYQVIRHGDDAGSMDLNAPDIDELEVFSQLKRESDNRPAYFLQIVDSQGILYPPHSQILSYAPNNIGLEAIDQRIPEDSFNEGMFLIVPLVDDVDFEGVRAEHGHYSRIWKDKLRQEFEYDAHKLTLRLRTAGLNLLHLRSAIHHWCNPPSTVIHAPKSPKHFRILLKVLGVNSEIDKKFQRRTSSFWRLAWQEIRRSRGEAIQAGVQAQEIITEELIEILRKFLPDIRELASTKDKFKVLIPNDYELHGTVLFFMVINIEEGFRVPESELKIIHTLYEVNQWRE